jgi:hypothetical protein
VHTFDGLVRCRTRRALGAAFENVDGVVDLLEEIVGIEVSIAIFARLEDDSGFPDGCEICQIKV